MGLRKAARLAFVAGLLLVLANTTGGSFLLPLGDQLAQTYLPADVARPVHLAISVVLFVAGLGGLAALAGGWLYRRGSGLLGNLLVDLGAGTGLLGLLLMLAVAALSGELRGLLLWLLGPAGLGVLLSILARREAGDSGVPKPVARAVRRALR